MATWRVWRSHQTVETGLTRRRVSMGGWGSGCAGQGWVPTKVDRSSTMECGMPMALGSSRRGRAGRNETMERGTKTTKNDAQGQKLGVPGASTGPDQGGTLVLYALFGWPSIRLPATGTGTSPGTGTGYCDGDTASTAPASVARKKVMIARSGLRAGLWAAGDGLVSRSPGLESGGEL